VRGPALIALAVLAGCGGRAPIAGCDDDLQGLYTAGGERWMILDRGTALEAYPMFPDLGLAGGPGETGPRLIDLPRPALTGTLRRRYMQGAARCEAQVPARLTRCTGETLELVLADPAPPLTFAPCTWPRPAASRVARWVRE
jgi:hypothetical protein